VRKRAAELVRIDPPPPRHVGILKSREESRGHQRRILHVRRRQRRLPADNPLSFLNTRVIGPWRADELVAWRQGELQT